MRRSSRPLGPSSGAPSRRRRRARGQGYLVDFPRAHRAACKGIAPGLPSCGPGSGRPSLLAPEGVRQPPGRDQGARRPYEPVGRPVRRALRQEIVRATSDRAFARVGWLSIARFTHRCRASAAGEDGGQRVDRVSDQKHRALRAAQSPPGEECQREARGYEEGGDVKRRHAGGHVEGSRQRDHA